MKASEILHGIAELLAGLETNNGTTQAAEVPVSKFTPNTQEPVSRYKSPKSTNRRRT